MIWIGDQVLLIIDTNAWVEYFLGTRSGQTVRELIQDEANEQVTLPCTLSELKSWSLRERKEFELVYQNIKTNSHILNLEISDWFLAADLKQEIRKNSSDFGLIDALLLAVGKRINAKVVSGDPHFKGLKDAIFLE